ncbi:molybdopterin-dependent oxidoreductase [Streptomyces sp. NPDC002044]|uniref:molybdopterin-dependent oxidoreductase n=1 Tax=Streptomyces sp. NPDC002044 TaxID=3154662 RepID=UPI00332850C8
MRPTLPPGPPVTFTARLHDARTATTIGRWLGLAFAVCFATGVLSHVLQHPPGWLADRLPSRPYWGYRLTQGLHVASGTAAVPLLLAKLWAVYPRLFAWPPVRSATHALERLSVAVLVAAALFQLFTGLLNTFQWYPWPFSFVPVHYAVAWVVTGALLLHVAVQWPRIRDHFTPDSPGTLALPAADGPNRRQLLYGVAAAVGAVTLTTVGQSVTALGRLDLFAPRSPAHGVQGLPVNRTAAAARVTRASLAGWRLTVDGPRPYALTLDELRAMPQHEVTLPIACVEGWSKSARWTGVRVRDLLERAGGGPGARARVVSLEAAGAYRVMDMGRLYAQDPLTLLALRLNGETLSLDHGYPARIIAPNRPGVLQTKWVARLEAV